MAAAGAGDHARDLVVHLNRDLGLEVQLRVARGATAAQVKRDLADGDPTGQTDPSTFALKCPPPSGRVLGEAEVLPVDIAELELCEVQAGAGPGDEGASREDAPGAGHVAEPPAGEGAGRPPGGPEPGAHPGESRIWRAVGGADKGGLLVRAGKGLDSPQCGSRLSTGALVQELARDGDRIHFLRLTGQGPASGWVSTKLKDKALLTEASSGEANARLEEIFKCGGIERWRDVLSSRERIALAGEHWHEVLDVCQDAGADEVKKAYRALSLLHHPDKNPSDDDDNTFKRVGRAYEEALRDLSDSAGRARRAALCQKMRLWLAGEGRSQPFFQPLDAEEVADMLLQDECTVLDVTDGAGTLTDEVDIVSFEMMSYMDMRLAPHRYDERLTQLREEEQHVVAVSFSGGRSSEFCCMLVDLFGFKESTVGYLHGGMELWRRMLHTDKKRRAKLEAKFSR